MTRSEEVDTSLGNGISSMLNKLTFGFFGPTDPDPSRPPVEGVASEMQIEQETEQNIRPIKRKPFARPKNDLSSDREDFI